MEYWQSISYKLPPTWVLLFTFDIFLGATKGITQEEVQQHLTMGGDLLARGQLQDALSHFHAAVEGDPKNYLTYFKRGTVYLALGKAKFAINDFNKVLELKPDFTGVRYQRGHVFLKQGSIDAAKQDFLDVYQLDNNGEAYNNYMLAESIQNKISTAEAYVKASDHYSAVDILNKVIEDCPWSSYLRELRSQCFVALNDPMSAILDLRSTAKLSSDNTEALFKLSILHYQLGDVSESLKDARECLKLDPDHKNCFPHYKKVKKIDKYLTNTLTALDGEAFDTCIENAKIILKTEEKVPMIRFVAYSKLGVCYLKNNEPSEAVNACSSGLDISRDLDLLCDRADAYIALDMFDEALRDFHEVLDNHESHERAKKGVQKVQKLQKQAEKRDYYKILGVKRSASKREIIKAYRKAAQQWHPDNFPDGAEKKKAEKKFIDIAAAKEVLTNEEKRSKFDNGEDPLDPESGNHEGFNPFQQFHHFQGSPFTFRFHFN